MSESRTKVLVIGYGNPGRLDDGLGPAFAAELDAKDLPGLTIDSDYQLTVEDAADIARHDVVVFADASVNCPEPFEFDELEAERNPPMSFSSHSISPAAVLGLAQTLFNGQVRGYLMGIRGYEFNEFGEALSDRAKQNLDAAVAYFVSELSTGRFDETPTVENCN